MTGKDCICHFATNLDGTLALCEFEECDCYCCCSKHACNLLKQREKGNSQ